MVLRESVRRPSLDPYPQEHPRWNATRAQLLRTNALGAD